MDTHTDKRIQPALRVGFDLSMTLPHRDWREKWLSGSYEVETGSMNKKKKKEQIVLLFLELNIYSMNTANKTSHQPLLQQHTKNMFTTKTPSNTSFRC